MKVTIEKGVVVFRPTEAGDPETLGAMKRMGYNFVITFVRQEKPSENPDYSTAEVIHMSPRKK